jgi:hypothetical protein
MVTDLDRAHKHSIRHREEILRSELCGCFGCLAIFSPSAITEWTDMPLDEHDEALDVGITALCPKCGIDSVIGSASGFPITQEFLAQMELRWFNLRAKWGRK